MAPTPLPPISRKHTHTLTHTLTPVHLRASTPAPHPFSVATGGTAVLPLAACKRAWGEGESIPVAVEAAVDDRAARDSAQVPFLLGLWQGLGRHSHTAPQPAHTPRRRAASAATGVVDVSGILVGQHQQCHRCVALLAPEGRADGGLQRQNHQVGWCVIVFVLCVVLCVNSGDFVSIRMCEKLVYAGLVSINIGFLVYSYILCCLMCIQFHKLGEGEIQI